MPRTTNSQTPALSQGAAAEKTSNKTQQAYDTIRHFIMSGIYAPGTRLSERSLQTQLNFSRTPIKAALEKLIYEGYLEPGSDKVAVVAKIGFSEVLEIYELRSVIEALSAKLAAARRTEADLADMEKCIAAHRRTLEESVEEAEHYDAQFHMLIARASRNTQIAKHLEQLIDHCRRASLYHNQSKMNRILRSIEQHEAILEEIRRMDEDGASEKMSLHIEDVIAMTKNLMADYYFLYK